MEKEFIEQKQETKTHDEDDIYIPKYEKTSNQGLVADDFHGEAPLLTNDETTESDEENGITINYGYKSDEAEKSLKIFQKNTIYKKNLIYTAILFVIFLMYAVDTIQDTTSFNMFLSAMCVVVIVFIWHFPRNHIKQMVKIINDTPYQENNVITFYEDSIRVGEGSTSAIYHYIPKTKRDTIRVWESDDVFTIGYGKERVFILPKRCCEDYTSQITAVLKNGLNDRYERIYTK